MTKRLVIFFLALLPVAVYGDLEVGVKKGLNLATQYGFERLSLRPELSRLFHIGFYADIPMAARMRLEAGAAYSFRGRMDRLGASFDRLTLQSITVPLTAKYVALESWIESTLYGGAEGVLTLAGSRYSGDASSLATIRLTSEELRLFDLGVVLGTEARVPFGPFVLLLDLRFTVGLLPSAVIDGERPRNALVSLLFGYGMRL